MTILIPDGGTVEGNGHTITALDPPLGFRGPELKSSGNTANVNNVGITTSLSDAFGCMGGDDRLRGIVFDGASGNITNNRVITIKRGLSSGCQEGNGIEIRNSANVGVPMVLIDNNVVRDYQKNGITANGAVSVTITNNVIQGAGRVDYIAQNGIQFGFGATGQVSGNSITDNFYTGCSHQDAAKTGCTPFVAAGLLLFDIDPSAIRRSNNTFINDQFNVLLVTHQSFDS
ncbi:MAG TPA: right-handed parallel beta-helix repeat-containing protein [Gemmatimonadales bacterium]|nr:right-handed parallel beta-helix repeat-containing protein [Gemmatimonadales bacterium]